MPTFACTHVEVYVFRRRGGRVEHLALRRSAGRSLGGVWQPVTGRQERGETALAAAAREVREETGLEPRRWWALETLTLFYDSEADAVTALPLFAAEVGARDVVRLSSEHDAHRFLTARDAAARFLWQAQRRGLEALRREVLRGGPLARALEVPAPDGAPRTRTRRRRQAP